MHVSKEDALRLLDYVYNRPRGDISQEIGGVLVTVAGIANSLNIDMQQCGDTEIERCELNTEKIRAKDLAKPARSPLPGAS